jgi:hypothetical protein
MGHQDAIQLKNMLVGLLAGVEKQLAAAAQANVSGTAGIGEKVLNSWVCRGIGQRPSSVATEAPLRVRAIKKS